MAGTRRQLEENGDPGQGKADPRLLHLRLWVTRLVQLRGRHRAVRPVGDEDGPPDPLTRVGEGVL